jgi:hypothetical protein
MSREDIPDDDEVLDILPDAPPQFPELTEAEIDAENHLDDDDTDEFEEAALTEMEWFDADSDATGFDWSAPNPPEEDEISIEDLIADNDPNDPDLD